MAPKTDPLQIARRLILGTLLIGLTVLTILHQKRQGIPTIDSLDPFGGLETLLKFVAGGTIIKKLEPGTIILFGGSVALAVLLSRFFCGWFCAFGALQAVFGWIGKKIFGRRKRPVVPARLDAVLRWVKFPVLILVVYFTWRTGDLVIRPYDPLAAYGHLSAGFSAIWSEFAIGFVILVATMGFSVVYERVFCKYLCPLGALNAIISRIPIFRIRRVASTCISCSKCDRVCPMNVDVSKPVAVDSPECIACMECVSACPTKKASLLTTLGGKTVRASVIVVLGFAIYAGAAAGGQAAGMLRFVPISLATQAAAGTLKVEDIKGSSTYELVAESFGIELERLYHQVGIDMQRVPPSTMLKDTGSLEGIKDFEADAVRAAVAKILGIPYSGETKGVTPTTVTPNPSPSATPLVVPPDFALEGTMSIADIAKALKSSTIAVIQKLGLSTDIATDKPLRDMREQYGYSMPNLKEKFK